MSTSLTDADRALFERVFWRIGDEDFPAHLEAFKKLLLAGLNAIDGKVPRHFDRVCSCFFSENAVLWPRYDAYLVHWNEADPRIEIDEDEEEPGDYAMPPGELLAHRIVMAFYAEKRRIRFLDNADDRPFWRLTVIEDGRAYPDCLNEGLRIQRFDSVYWQHKKLPCERLFCRCRMQALTEAEAEARSN